jgi:hypothetical protein
MFVSKKSHTFAAINLKKMYRKVFTPTEFNHTISIPREWYGKTVEIIAFPVISTPEAEPISDEEFFKLSGSWTSDQPAEEMVAELKAARKFREKDFNF